MRNDKVKSLQLRAARTLLDWSQEDLAQASKLSIGTIRKLEAGYIPRHATMQFAYRALEAAGLEFVEPGGVRYRPEDITVYKGAEEITVLFDDIYQTSKKKGGEILAVCDSESALFPIVKSEALIHFERMLQIRDRISVKCILRDSNSDLHGQAYSEYRLMVQHEPNLLAFLIYGDKCAVATFGEETANKIMVIQSSSVLQFFRQQFLSMWKKAKPLKVKTPNRKTKNTFE